MRTQFLQVATKEEAENECLWACEIVEVEGGFRAFESSNDFDIWNNQQ